MSDPVQHESFLGCFTQIFRILVGPALIFIAAVALAANRPPLGSAFDAAFGLAVFLTVAAGFLERRNPSSGRRRYAMSVVGVSAALFIVVRFLIPRVW